MICPNCHAEVSDSQLFCSNCGTQLAQAQATTQAVPSSSYEAQQPVEVVAEPIPHTGRDTTAPYGNAADQVPYGNASQQAPYGNAAQQSPYGSAAQQPPYSTAYSHTPTQQPGYAPNAQQPVSNVPFGLAIAALVCSILGMVLVGLVLAIVALVMNSNQKKQGTFSSKQTPTTVMSIISIVLSIFWTVIIAFAIFLVAAESTSGDLNISTSDDGSTITLTDPSGSSVNLNSDGSVTVTSPSDSSASASASSSSADASASSGAAAAAGTIGSSSAASSSSDFIGSWELSWAQGSSFDEGMSTEALDMMREYGYNVTLDINEDGTFTMAASQDESLSGTWSQTSESELELVVSSYETINASFEGSELVLKDSSDTLAFRRR